MRTQTTLYQYCDIPTEDFLERLARNLSGNDWREFHPVLEALKEIPAKDVSVILSPSFPAIAAKALAPVIKVTPAKIRRALRLTWEAYRKAVKEDYRSYVDLHYGRLAAAYFCGGVK
jgi:hypothetical protein